MNGRTVLCALAAATTLTGPVAPARAFHHWGRCCGQQPTTTFYAPLAVAAPAPTCCAQPQVVNYMPQTAYRTVYVNMPVTTFQPVAGCDACGRPTTVMRPVTSFVAQPQLVPYTTFRPTIAAMPVAAVAQPCCGATPSVTSYAPAVSVAPVAAPACCTPTSATTVTPVPAAAPSYSPAPITSSPIPAPNPAPLTPVPSLEGPPAQSKQTFENSPSDLNAPQSRVLMPPAENGSSLINRPHGLDPEAGDRTTAIPLYGGASVRQASLVSPSKATALPDDNDGWRAGK